MDATSDADIVIGADRDDAHLFDALRRGDSVLLVGTLGSGKTHLLGVVERAARRSGIEPLTVRGGGHAVDARLAALEAGSGDGRYLVLVDDAHRLTPASMDALLGAVHRGRATALMTVGVPKGRTARGSATRAASDLMAAWPGGDLARVDLSELSPVDADALLDLFAGEDPFDAVTRAAVLELADGSRTLLRELAARASGAVAEGADPLVAIRRVVDHRRLGDAVHAHVREIGDDDRTALALLHRVRGIARTDALRLLRADTIDSLVGAGMVHEDATTHRRLFPNPLLAAEADHQTVDAAVEGRITRVASAMLAPHAAWWSAPVASALAVQWLHAHDVPAALDDVESTTRERVALTAARSAADRGEHELAAAFSTLPGLDTRSPALRVELAEATQRRDRAGDAMTVLRSAGDVDDDTLSRLLRRRGVRDGDTAMLARRVDDRDDEPRAEFTLALAENAVVRMEWSAAQAQVSEALTIPRLEDSARMRALIMSAVAQLNTGSWEQALALLDEMHRLIDAPTHAPSVTASERALALCVHLVAAQSTARDDIDIAPRLPSIVAAALHEEDPVAVVLAGLAAGLIRARAGDAAGATREVDMAVTRAGRLTMPPWVAVLELSIARAVALAGDVASAERLLRRAVPDPNDLPPYLEHARLLTESTLLGVHELPAEAREFAAAAAAVSEGTESWLLAMRDLFQLVAVGAGDDDVLRRMRRAAAALELPAAEQLVAHAAAIVRGRGRADSPVTLLRREAPWSSEEMLSVVRAPSAAPRPRLTAVTAPPDATLTRREREIAALIEEGLANREIAERLFLSVRTVESHIFQARQKIGARSRTELGRMVGAAPLADGTTGR